MSNDGSDLRIDSMPVSAAAIGKPEILIHLNARLMEKMAGL